MNSISAWGTSCGTRGTECKTGYKSIWYLTKGSSNWRLFRIVTTKRWSRHQPAMWQHSPRAAAGRGAVPVPADGSGATAHDSLKLVRWRHCSRARLSPRLPGRASPAILRQQPCKTEA